MDLEKGFDKLQEAADADPEIVRKARERRDLFNDGLGPLEDVVEVVASGSLARGTQRDPINDVDVIVVFDSDAHPTWGEDGASAGEALDHVQSLVRQKLGSTEGAFAKEVRLASPRNHAVKCFLDDPENPDAFTVDVMPALRHKDGHLIAPEKKNSTWIQTDPEGLIRRVMARQEEWPEFRSLVRILKMWNQEVGASMKSLVVEVLALSHLPAESGRDRALQRFFSAAEIAIESPVEDPSGHCGEIQPDLDRAKVKECLAEAASNSWRACDARDSGDTDRAACFWNRVFGEAFPEPEDGCPKEEEEESGGLGSGIAVGGLVGIDRPRPVRDAPQGLT
jgi:hypothetical protein